MAGALSRRDIEMIFRAETDKATRPIADLGKAVKATRGELADLVEAAAKGEVSLDKLGATTRDLKKAQDELGTARALLTQLNAQEVALSKAQDRAATAAVKYEQLKDAVAAADSPSKKLVSSMEAAGRATQAAGEKLNIVQAEAQQTREQIEAIIGPVANMSTAFRTVATTGAEIARGLAVAGAAADDFKQKMSSAADTAEAAKAKLASDTAFQQAGQSAGLLQAQIDYISQFENRVELLAQAKRELTAQNAAFDQALTAQEAKVGAANVSELRTQITATFAEADRVARVAGFQQIAVQAKAAATDVARFGVSEDAAVASTQRFADAIQAILNPGGAAQRTLESIEASVINASTALDGKGRKSATEYANALNEIQSAAAGIGSIAQKIDVFRGQEQRANAAAAAFHKLQAETIALAEAIRTADNPTQEMVNDLAKLQAQTEVAGNDMQREATKAVELSVALKRAGVDTNNLAAAEAHLAEQARNAAGAQDQIRGKLGGKGGFLGLSVNDAQNLSYQINDIFTQLASGQGIVRTLAQQGPQIWQIGGVQGWLAQMGPVLAVLGGLAAGFGAVALAAVGVYKATSPNAETQAATVYLTMLGEKSDITAKQMGSLSHELERFGEKAKDAQAIAQDFVQAGLNPDYIDTYATALRNAAQVTGTDMKDASTALTDALTGGFDAVVKLNEAYPVLSDAELDQIRNMYDAGQADEARQLIFDRFTEKMQDAADKMNGGWSNAWRNLKDAAADFGSYIAGKLSGFLQGLRKDLDEAAIGVNYLLLRMRGLSVADAGNAAVNNQGRAPTKPKAPGSVVSGQPKSTPQGRAAVAEAQRNAKSKRLQTRKEQVDAAKAEARRRGQSSGFGNADVEALANIAGGKASADFDDKAARAGAAAGRRAASQRKAAAKAAESAQNKVENAAEALQTQLDQMGVKVAKVAAGSLEDQLTNAGVAVNKQYEKLYRQLDDFSKLTKGKGKVGDMTIAQYRDQLDANKAILVNQGKLKVYEDNINDVLAQRKALLADIEDQRQRGQISAADAISKTAEVTSRFDPIIANLTSAAIQFATNIGGAKPSAELTAFIGKMTRIQNQNAGGSQEDNRAAANAGIGAEEGKLNKILSERNSLVDSYNTLVALGAMTQDDARKKTAAAYNAAKPLITDQIASLRAALDAAKELGAITPQAYDAYIAKMQAIGAEADYLDPRFAQLKNGIDQIVTQNSLDFINKLAESFGNAIAGTESWGEALRDAGYALLDFIAQTIRNVAQLIIQMIILDAVQQATGIPVAALLGAMNGGGGTGGMGGGGGGIFGFLGKLFHAGTGSVGAGGSGRRTSRISLSPAAIAAAPRYHDGTPSVGLKPNEQVAVLENGEKVMTKEQQRQEDAAKARNAGGNRSIRNVLAIGDDQVAAAMAGPAGQDVVLTHLRRNAPAVKQLLD
jgi:hypothetical protein